MRGGLVYPPFELRQLYYFVTVAEEGQITRAAARLISPSPRSRRRSRGWRTRSGSSCSRANRAGSASRPPAPRSSRRHGGPSPPRRKPRRSLGRTCARRAAGPRLHRRLSPGRPPDPAPLHRRATRRSTPGYRNHHARRLLDLKAGLIDAELLLAPGSADPTW